jgi:hypothetical protein
MNDKTPFGKMVAKINRLIYDKKVLRKARRKPTYFIRDRKMTFPELLLVVLAKINTSTQTALNRYLKKAREHAEHMSQQAFSKARSHIDHSPWKLCFQCNHVPGISFRSL